MRLFSRLPHAIAVRFTLAVGFGLGAVTAAIGIHVVNSEERELHDAVAAEMLLLTRSVQIAFENAIRDRQLADIEETLTELEAIDPRTDIAVLDGQGRVVAHSQGSAQLPSVPADGDVHFLSVPPSAAIQVALQIPVGNFSRLILARPLDSMLQDLARTRQQVVLTGLASITASTLLLLVLFRRSVERPLARMTSAMRRFRELGLPELQEPFADDEVGDASREFAALARELHDARERLEREQGERAALEQHLVQLDKLAAAGQLSARVAHEIGSPLQVLEGRLAALQRELGEQAGTRRLVEIAIEQTQRIGRVVSQLLSLARPSPPTQLDCDPVRTTRSIVEFLEIDARRRGVKVELDVTAAPRRAAIEADHLSQIVFNLLRNALQASARDDKVVVILRAAPGADGNRLELSVQDAGAGMSEQVQARIFEPFFTTRLDHGGTGLGLSIVRSLLRPYGGKVHVVSAPGQGARFEVVIPHGEPAQEQAQLGAAT